MSSFAKKLEHDGAIGRLRLNVSGANIRRTDLSHANLTGADLSGANCSYVNFRGANFKNARLKGAKLFGADLTDAVNLTKKQIEEALIDKTTILPSYLAKEFA